MQALDNLVAYLNELAKRSIAALGYDKPLIETRESAKRRERNSVLVRGNLVERRNQVKRGKHRSSSRGVEDPSGDSQLAEAADLVEFLAVHGDPNASRILRDDHQRARMRKGRVLDQA